LTDVDRSGRPSGTAAYGGWSSPITPAMMARAPASLEFPRWVDGNLYWQESRPADNGRTLVVRRSADGDIEDLLPSPWNVRSRVHEYGGLCWLVSKDTLFFVNFEDQRLYRLELDRANAYPQPLTPEAGDWRFADFCYDSRRQRLIAVAERIRPDRADPENSIVAIDREGRIETLVAGADFYACPRLSPDWSQLCWLAWHHPQMPWDGTELVLGELDAGGGINRVTTVAGGPDESIFQPEWSPDGTLYFVSDRSGWWNLYRQNRTSTTALLPMDAEFGLPLWNLGMSTYGFIGEGGRTILCSYCGSDPDSRGNWQLALLDTATGCLENLTTACTAISGVSANASGGCFVGASHDSPPRIHTLNAQGRRLQVVNNSESDAGDTALRGWFSRPRSLSFATGPADGEPDRAHGFYYPPHNPDYRAPRGTRPPLLVICHGGPTAATSTALNYKVQFWTSRGFAVVDVNYRGSSGYGRAYREKLNGYWGVRDVEDVIAAAGHCVEQGLADPSALIIRGSSAGGYTVLAALIAGNTFRVGASLYGIGDLETLVRDTHKFESRYLDRLVGPYPAMQSRYRQRSPIHHLHRFRCPVIFFQGLEDRVVPPQQAIAMVDALDRKGIPVAYVAFAEEGHGFRRKANVSRAFEAELYFYRLVLGIDSGEKLKPVPVRNWPAS